MSTEITPYSESIKRCLLLQISWLVEYHIRISNLHKSNECCFSEKKQTINWHSHLHFHSNNCLSKD